MATGSVEEVALALDRAAKDRGFRVFPVLLPGFREPFDPNALPPFLRTRTWVDFRRGDEDPRALQDLIHAIKGMPFGPETVDRAAATTSAPTAGCRCSTSDTREFFFGRDAEIQRLLEKLKRDALPGGPRSVGQRQVLARARRARCRRCMRGARRAASAGGSASCARAPPR